MARKRIGAIIAAVLLVAALPLFAAAEEASYKDTALSAVGLSAEKLSDGCRSSYTIAEEGAEVTLSRSDGITRLYIEFDRIPGEWTLQAMGKEYSCGTNGFLHEYINITPVCGVQERVTLRFPKGTAIADIYAFGEGTLPAFVQTWEAPCEKADMMLISSHSDDEQLFFAGLLPYYAVERKLEVQVVYIVQHFEAYGSKDHVRPHEQLDGLWTVGVRNYPVMSEFPDLYSESFEGAEAAFRSEGYTYDDFKGYITECLRRFKPLVVVSHDLRGEYGHGTHIFCANALTEAIALAVDEKAYPASAEKYGTHRPEKTYLHLYEENPIVMDWDTPLESLGGKTPFQMTQEGFGCHKSQHWTWFKRWIYGRNNEITKATQIDTYSPCKYGLYDTLVGVDKIGGDMMENVATYAQREEAYRKDQAEREAAAKAEAERLAAEKAAAEAAAARRGWWIGGSIAAAVLIIAAAAVLLAAKKRRR